jgi:hypothetical protein
MDIDDFRYCVTLHEKPPLKEAEYDNGDAEEGFHTLEEARAAIDRFRNGPRFRLAVLYDSQSGEWEYLEEHKL